MKQSSFSHYIHPITAAKFIIPVLKIKIEEALLWNLNLDESNYISSGFLFPNMLKFSLEFMVHIIVRLRVSLATGLLLKSVLVARVHN